MTSVNLLQYFLLPRNELKLIFKARAAPARGGRCRCACSAFSYVEMLAFKALPAQLIPRRR